MRKFMSQLLRNELLANHIAILLSAISALFVNHHLTTNELVVSTISETEDRAQFEGWYFAISAAIALLTLIVTRFLFEFIRSFRMLRRFIDHRSDFEGIWLQKFGQYDARSNGGWRYSIFNIDYDPGARKYYLHGRSFGDERKPGRDRHVTGVWSSVDLDFQQPDTITCEWHGSKRSEEEEQTDDKEQTSSVQSRGFARYEYVRSSDNLIRTGCGYACDEAFFNGQRDFDLRRIDDLIPHFRGYRNAQDSENHCRDPKCECHADDRRRTIFNWFTPNKRAARFFYSDLEQICFLEWYVQSLRNVEPEAVAHFGRGDLDDSSSEAD